MPHLWYNTLVVTQDELVPHWYSESSLKVTIHRYKDKPYGIKKVRRGCNGRRLLIAFDSLDPNIQDKLGDPRKIKHILEKFYRLDGDAVQFYAGFRFDDGTYLTTEYQEKYAINASMLIAAKWLRAEREKDRRGKGISTQNVFSTVVDDVKTFNEVLEKKHKIKHTLPEGIRQFRNVLKAFETLGYQGLISKKHKNLNTLKVTSNTIELLNNIFAGQSYKPTAIEVFRNYESFLSGRLEVVNNETGECYSPGEFKTLSAATVTKYIAQWDNKIATYAKRSGNRQMLIGQFKPFHSLNKPKFAGSILSIDDRQPPFRMDNGKRVWFYNGYDIASECFTCWVYGESKEGIIGEFYRQMVRNYAEWGLCLPAELECEMSLNSSFRDTFLREGVMFKRVRMEANNARGKYIERVFGKLRYQYEKDKKGWLARPHALQESNQAKSPLEKTHSLPFDEIVEGCLQDIENWNNEPHSLYPDKSRWQVFLERQHPDLQPTNYGALLPHIGYKTQTSCNVGQVRLQNGFFLLGDNGEIAIKEKLINIMKQIEGKTIDVYWLDDNQGQVLKAFAYLGDKPICELIRKPTYNRASIEQNQDDINAQQLMTAYVRSIDNFAKERGKLINPVTLIDNAPQRPKLFKLQGLRWEPPITEEPPEILPDVPDDDDIWQHAPSISFVNNLIDRY